MTHNGKDDTTGLPQDGWLLVTPAMATKFLRHNTHENQRKVRQTHVEYLAEQITLDRWYRTSEGIGFAEDGTLIDGQHRLMAIVLADKPAWLLIVGELDLESFVAHGRGKVRTAADVTGLSTQRLADATLIWGIIHPNAHGKRVSEIDQRDTAAWWAPACDAIVGGTKLSRSLASAALRVGYGARWAIQGTKTGRAYVVNQFRALQKGDLDAMSYATGALWKRAIRDKFGNGSAHRITSTVLCYYYADPVRENLAPVLKNPQVYADELKNILSNMETAYLHASPGDPHPYKFDSSLEQRRISAKVSERRVAADQSEEHPSP